MTTSKDNVLQRLFGNKIISVFVKRVGDDTLYIVQYSYLVVNTSDKKKYCQLSYSSITGGLTVHSANTVEELNEPVNGRQRMVVSETAERLLVGALFNGKSEQELKAMWNEKRSALHNNKKNKQDGKKVAETPTKPQKKQAKPKHRLPPASPGSLNALVQRYQK